MRRLTTMEPVDVEPVLLTAGSIHTVSAAAPRAEALLLASGRIAAVGTADACRARATELGLRPAHVDLGDATVVPGFVDPHAHPLMHGQLKTWVDCGPAHAASIDEIVALLRAAADASPPGRPVRGYGYEQQNLAERRHPTRFELDEVAGDREVYLMNASGHGGVVNSYTLALHHVDRTTPDPPGGRFFRDADGDLTGELSDAACNVLTGVHGVKVGRHGPNFHLADSADEHLRHLTAAQQDFLAGGVTTIGDCQVSSREMDTWLRLAETGGLHVRVSMYLLSHLLDDAVRMGLHGAFGNAHLAFAGIKLYADGTLGGCTAYFPDGYLDDPCRTGLLYHEPEAYADLVLSAHRVGLQTATHAQSPTAIGMVVDAIAAAQADTPRADARHRVEHCGLPTAAQIARMAELGIVPVNQPQHHFNWGEGVRRVIGTPGERFNPLGAMAEAGLPVTLSSDAPVADPRPLQALQAAASRVTRSGWQLGPDTLALSPAAALEAHTLTGARALGRESEIGSLETGKRADFAVLTTDPLTVEATAIGEIDVIETWIDGRRVHRNGTDTSDGT